VKRIAVEGGIGRKSPHREPGGDTFNLTALRTKAARIGLEWNVTIATMRPVMHGVSIGFRRDGDRQLIILVTTADFVARAGKMGTSAIRLRLDLDERRNFQALRHT
jgi:hypothetical protein